MGERGQLMERRTFIERLLSGLALGGLFLLGGCAKKEQSSGHGNQEKLWNLVTGQEKGEQPIDLTDAKQTPAIYRDASMGKADPNFVPKVAGG
jgi:hypothetical protein